MDRTTRTEQFEQHRPRLIAVATRALGSRADAEDAVQEAWLRLDRYDGAPIANLGGWLTRVVGRICIDVLRSRTAHPETDFDDADPVVTEGDGPEDVAVAADTVGLALLVVLDSLGPEERLAFVLHDLFAVPFAEVGAIVGRSPDAAKMAASRARRRVQGGPRPMVERREQRAVVDAFLAAARRGDFEALLAVLDPDLTWTRRTPRGEVVTIGANAVLEAVRRGDPSRIEARRVSVNGAPGILAWGPTGKPVALMACTVVGGRIVDVVSIVDPARLARMDLPSR
ncbi:sigma-70 family RNA polymerase sigma factor [Tsukamurella paurometabola]|uniref:RNA polymerase sigma factor SigJ n=1 Tax=Tsukamurella paurometabola TaxID=2061 RepID=A0A3P8LEZ7_TSUPA|nr:sigma-70 family RNA polymerase sigma factor [Tsukamurella paurometabola]UEA82235.1 sigma-70 family RNA polymerase sigma factor [Tsukamurella paurometabola]VDR39282.1 RNA polymerase sigma factor SigJ [Tsukamurella paurometabola]